MSQLGGKGSDSDHNLRKVGNPTKTKSRLKTHLEKEVLPRLDSIQAVAKLRDHIGLAQVSESGL